MRIAIYIIKNYLFIILLTILLIITGCAKNINADEKKSFEGERALRDVELQLELGPRIPGSEAHQQAVEWIISQLENSGWQVDVQEAFAGGIRLKNIIAKRGAGENWIILGSHYDSREFANNEQTVDGRQLPVPGANDGASSTAVLIELARVVQVNPDQQVWLVFFDAEDISSDDIAVGSQYFVDNLTEYPDDVVILDMIGDKDLNINMEWNSNPDLNQEIWGVAKQLGYTQFIPAYKYSILDDHIPFINAGIRAVDVIDFDYPYWHTTEDTLDKVSAESLDAVGETILKWLELNETNN